MDFNISSYLKINSEKIIHSGKGVSVEFPAKIPNTLINRLAI